MPTAISESTLAIKRAPAVDDNPTKRLILEEVLAHWSIRAVEVDSGPAALRVLEEAAQLGEPFQVVLPDQQMPELDGLSLAEQVRGNDRIATTKMLLLTSDVGPEDAIRCRALGISACLTKPVRHSELMNALMDLFRVCEGPADRLEREVLDTQRTECPNGFASQRLRIRLAEDHPINQIVAVRMLETSGHHVTVACDRSVALARLESDCFDVVLMDVQKPEMDGSKAAATRQKEAHSGRHIPIVALTAQAMKGDREHCLESGFERYSATPVQEMELRATLGVVTAGHNGGHDSHGRPFITGLLEQCGDDEGFARELASSFLKTAPASPDAMTEARAADNSVEIGTTAHRRKGACPTIGAVDFAEACGLLDAAGHLDDEEAVRIAFDAVREAWEPLKQVLERLIGERA